MSVIHVQALERRVLLAVNPAVLAFGFRDSLLTETAAWSAVLDPHDGQPRLYRRADWLQESDLASHRPDLAGALLARAERARRLNDHLLRRDRIWPGD